ncbi:hypothetical protein GCM10009831_24510 [Dietzia cercidiphylli]|uniref:Uncharacterized protein n=1 Tax=Dietzia cercidiphylli TaxID=498199 RepID=A0ABP4V0I7_9ACTN
MHIGEEFDLGVWCVVPEECGGGHLQDVGENYEFGDVDCSATAGFHSGDGTPTDWVAGLGSAVCNCLGA